MKSRGQVIWAFVQSSQVFAFILSELGIHWWTQGNGETWSGFKSRSCETMTVVLERDAEALPQESSSGG